MGRPDNVKPRTEECVLPVSFGLASECNTLPTREGGVERRREGDRCGKRGRWSSRDTHPKRPVREFKFRHAEPFDTGNVSRRRLFWVDGTVDESKLFFQRQCPDDIVDGAATP
ncbi:hypothetical protein GCM10009000_062350 [Halobacterium noricense]|uniref:Uncharacterized protein n=1 Tax=Haladaptatus pallidirubidus TaxID=1008152 RepID=A0AAV3UJY8_9EURY